jgi:hypothetical protein
MRRLNECDRPAPRPAQRRTQQPKFSDTWVLHEKVHQCAYRPSAARQFR